jgi:nucleotide-binding universal stress UspA family protein
MIKDVLVHLDGSTEDETCLVYAEAIASLSNGHLTGVYTNLLPDFAMAMPIDGGAAAAQIMGDLEDRSRENGNASCRLLRERLARVGVPNELRRFDATMRAMGELVASQARCSDLFVATRPYRGDGGGPWTDLIETVLFGSGRGLLLVPPGGRPHGPIKTVLVAWQDTREAARAVGEALTLIRPATSTVVVSINSNKRRSHDKGELEADIARHLDRHGALVEARVLDREERGVSEILLDQARRVSADLIVMGGYGHSRIREWILSGTTLEMLTVSEFPILIAN